MRVIGARVTAGLRHSPRSARGSLATAAYLIGRGDEHRHVLERLYRAHRQAIQIIGLEPFLSTMDYPGRRVLLSLRNASPARAQHLAVLRVPTAVVPFYLWGDHYMFARGAIGDRTRLTFFVDSGLVSLHPDDAGGIRQASFTSSGRKFAQWGVSRSEIKKGHFESTSPLCLGSLCQERPLFVVGDAAGNPAP